MALQRGVRYRADDIWDTPDDGNRYEVIDGMLYMTPPPVVVHQRSSGWLYGYIWSWIRPRQLGELLSAPVGVVLDDGNGVQPDLVFVSRDRLHLIAERGIEGVPDLVVEVLSPSTRSRDLGIKMRRYAASGVKHYWIVDPRGRTIEEYVLGDDGYELVSTSGLGMIFRPLLFPGLEIPVDDIWG